MRSQNVDPLPGSDRRDDDVDELRAGRPVAEFVQGQLDHVGVDPDGLLFEIAEGRLDQQRIPVGQVITKYPADGQDSGIVGAGIVPAFDRVRHRPPHRHTVDQRRDFSPHA